MYSICFFILSVIPSSSSTFCLFLLAVTCFRMRWGDFLPSKELFAAADARDDLRWAIMFKDDSIYLTSGYLVYSYNSPIE